MSHLQLMASCHCYMFGQKNGASLEKAYAHKKFGENP